LSVPTSRVTKLLVPDTFSEVPTSPVPLIAVPKIFELVRFAKLEVPDTFSDVPAIVDTDNGPV
jgi:hypothetical protein